MEAHKVNGYRNQETYDLALWCLNDQGLYECLKNQHATEIQLFFEQQQELLIESPFELTEDMRRLLLDVGSFWRVEWREIAAALSDDEVIENAE